MGWKTLQSVDEAARAMLTHRCRYRPGLKLRPEHCDLYRGAKANPRVADLGSDAILCHQWECPGPIEIQGHEPKIEPVPAVVSDIGTVLIPEIKTEATVVATKPKKAGIKILKRRNEKNEVIEVKRLDGHAVCCECGLENGKGAEFYPSRPDKCVACIKAQDKARKEGGTAIADRFLQRKEQEQFKYNCDLHGPHNGRMIGRNQSDKCPVCFSEMVSEKIKLQRQGVTENSISLPAWLVEWVVETSARDGITPSEYVTGCLAPNVDAEWLKLYVLRGKAIG